MKYLKLFENFQNNNELNPDGTLNGISAKPSPFGKYKRYVFGKRKPSFSVDPSVVINDEEAYMEINKKLDLGMNLNDFSLLNIIFLPEYGNERNLPVVSFWTEGSESGKEAIDWHSVGGDSGHYQFLGHNSTGSNYIRIENELLNESPILRSSTVDESEFDNWLSKAKRQ
jgi:hypothetical protein